MPARFLIENYRLMRGRPMWSLLASDSAPETIACLQVLLFDEDRHLPVSVFAERLKLLLNEVYAESIESTQVQAKLNAWRNAGYIAIRYMDDASDEPFVELTSASHSVISFIVGQRTSRASPTESRLELLIHAIRKLATDTDQNATDRIARLEEDKKRIDEQIEAIREGRAELASDMEIRAQVEDLLAMLENLNGDFYRIRDRLRELSAQLHESIMRSEGTAGGILDDFFKGYDQITDSDEGKTFRAFYEFLSSAEAMAQIEEAVDALQERPFWEVLVSDKARKDIISIRRDLNARARETQNVMRLLAGSLKHLVQSRDFTKNRRMRELITQAKREALDAREAISVQTKVFSLPHSCVAVSSNGVLELYDTEMEAIPVEMSLQSAPEVDLFALAKRVQASDINYPRLKEQVCDVLTKLSVASVADVLSHYPAEQGLASIVGLVSLAIRYGVRGEDEASESVVWQDRFNTQVKAHLPVLLFTPESLQRLRRGY